MEKRPVSDYQSIYIWRIIEPKMENLEPPIQVTNSFGLRRFCVENTVPRGQLLVKRN